MQSSRLMILGALALAAALAEPLTKDERSVAMSHLHATRRAFLESVAGLSDAQWNFKAAPERWSIAECAEHIAASEDLLYQMTMQMMKSPVEPGKKAANKDDRILQAMTDRSFKAQAPEMLQPKRRWPDRESLLTAFKQSRDRNIAYIEKTGDDLRSHFMEHPLFKTMDGYQAMLMLSAHSERHTAQINEVKAAAGYPKQ